MNAVIESSLDDNLRAAAREVIEDACSEHVERVCAIEEAAYNAALEAALSLAGENTVMSDALFALEAAAGALKVAAQDAALWFGWAGPRG